MNCVSGCSFESTYIGFVGVCGFEGALSFDEEDAEARLVVVVVPEALSEGSLVTVF